MVGVSVEEQDRARVEVHVCAGLPQLRAEEIWLGDAEEDEKTDGRAQLKQQGEVEDSLARPPFSTNWPVDHGDCGDGDWLFPRSCRRMRCESTLEAGLELLLLTRAGGCGEEDRRFGVRLLSCQATTLRMSISRLVAAAGLLSSRFHAGSLSTMMLRCTVCSTSPKGRRPARVRP